MQRKVGTVEFEDQDFSSILEHARKLEGKRLDQIAKIICKPKLMFLQGKGAPGQLIQAWFGLSEFDSKAEADLPGVRFPDGSVGAVEIKVVPLIERRRGYSVKERCKVTNIDYAALVKEEWGRSRAKKKLFSVIFIYYAYAGSANWTGSKVKKIVAWEVDKEALKSEIENDWNRTHSYVSHGRAHEISEAHNIILGASTAGAGGLAKLVSQPGNAGQPARKRAFSLKPAFLKTTYGVCVEGEKFGSIRTLSNRLLPADLHTAILQSIEPHIGKTLGQISKDLGVDLTDSKQGAALLIRRALGVADSGKRLLELEAIGVRPKIATVRVGDLCPCEAMSFPQVHLKEMVEEEWESSEFRTYLDCLLVIPIFAIHCKKQAKKDRVLGRPFFWSPSPEDENGIAQEWEVYKQEILSGKAAYTRVNGKRKSRLTKYSGTKWMHLRPKGPNGSKDNEDSVGNKTQQLCYWLNKDFIQRILKDEHGRKRLL